MKLQKHTLVFNMILVLVSIVSIWTNKLSATEILIENITLISPERSSPLKSAWVYIVNDKIVEVSAESIKVDKAVKRINGIGKYLIPGLMDSHVHVSSMPGAPLSHKDKVVEDLEQQFFIQQPRSYLYFGVTQLLDPSQSREALEQFDLAPVKPDLFHCGAVPIFGGYPALYVNDDKAAEIYNYLVVEETAESAFTHYPKNFKFAQHSPEKVVQKMAKNGAICVKVFIEDGFGLQSQWPLIAQSTVKRLKAEAETFGFKVLAHANAIDMQQIALALNVDVIAHGMWNWNELDGSSELPPLIKATLDQIMRQQVTYQPTLGVMRGLRDVLTSNVLHSPHFSKVVSQKTLDWYLSHQGQWFQQEMIRDYDGLPIKEIQLRQNQLIAQGDRVLAYLNQNNYPLVLASDTPAAPTYAQQPGLSTYQEILRMHRVGVSLKRILEAATINNAKAFNLDDQYGTITPGKKANLLVLSKNPLEIIEAYDSIDKIIIKGLSFDRKLFEVGGQ